MAEYQITLWRDIPSMVVARDGDDVTKIQLAARFQEAIDEAAMRLGEVGSDDYLAGWTRSDWTTADGDHAHLAGVVAEQLENEWTSERTIDYLNGIGPAVS
ncbi:MAG: virulence factor [Actinomycetia bacterium]|nr:virulence factor [Actinomycetes bacterium]